MKTRVLVVALVGLSTALSACHKKAPTTQPTPEQTPAPQPPPPPPSASPGNTGGSGNPVDVEARRAGLVNTLHDMIHFDYDQSAIKGDDTGRLDSKVAILRDYPQVRIRITGHCDERGSDEYNIALGMRRAQAAKEYLVRAGIDAGRIEVASLGREVPIDPASNEGAWAKNRRDEFDVIAGNQTLGTRS
jgi:peptidoglycan-associated lipoprotein